jgi:hypothetical protein
MHFKKLLFLSLFLAVAAFGLYGFNTLINSQIPPTQAAAPADDQPGDKPATLTLANATACGGIPAVSTVEFLPAPELPARAPDAGGVFGSLEGKTLTLQSFRVETTADGQGVSVFGGSVAGAKDGVTAQAGVMVTSGSFITSKAGEDTPGTVTGGCEAGQPMAGSVTVMHSAAGTDPAQLSISGALPALPADGSTVTVFGPGGTPLTPTTQKVAVTDATKIYHDVTPMLQMPASGKQTVQQTLEAGSLSDLTGQTMVTVWGHQDGDQLIADVILYQTPPTLK